MEVRKSDGSFEEFSAEKVKSGIYAAYKKTKQEYDEETGNRIVAKLTLCDGISTEEIRSQVEECLMDFNKKVAKAYIRYGENEAFIKDREKYMEDYVNQSDENAASLSETDPNANQALKNVATLEGEVYKTQNRNAQRKRMKDKLKTLFPEVADQYKKDLEESIIYAHDEASTPALKYYCQAVSLYPLMSKGVGNIDGVTPSAPNDLQSFGGQVTNLVFLLSAQCKGAVALGEYQLALVYYTRMEYGKDWLDHVDEQINTIGLKKKTIRTEIRKCIKQFIYGICQPASNRNNNSPFTNISIYDRTYYEALFKDFYYPDGTQCTWEEVDYVQRLILELRRELNLIKPLTFPVTTIAMVNDGNDIIDKEYKHLCAEEWAKGSSHFCYNSNNPSSLASCCRVLNEITENTFSSVNGLQGIMTGSCNVITVNLNRIIQRFIREKHADLIGENGIVNGHILTEEEQNEFRAYFSEILERVYKYHIAYKTMLYEQEDKKMFASSNGGYIYIRKLYSTVGLIGYQESAMFMGLDISKNDDYINFLNLLLSTVKEQNKVHSIHDKKRPFLFNSEAIPGENLAVKFYQKDKKDGYYVPKDRNLFASYFFNPWDDKISVLDKMYLHGECTSKSTDGGQACHINLMEDLSVEQYEKLIDYSTKEKTTYWTINRPISTCPDCGYVHNGPLDVCPKCGCKEMDWWTRIIGYLRPLSSFSKERFKEAKRRVYSGKDCIDEKD